MRRLLHNQSIPDIDVGGRRRGYISAGDLPHSVAILLICRAHISAAAAPAAKEPP